MNNRSTIQPINGIGGSPSFLQRMTGFLSSWQILAVIAVAILLIVIGYYTYKEYANNSTTFNPNIAEQNTNNSDNGSQKTATLMLFYVDWCPHCKTAKPEWEELKSEYDGKSINGYTITIMEYNCTNESADVSQLMDKYNIEGYPTIKLIKDNQIIEYDAKPTKTTMEQFLNTVL